MSHVLGEKKAAASSQYVTTVVALLYDTYRCTYYNVVGILRVGFIAQISGTRIFDRIVFKTCSPFLPGKANTESPKTPGFFPRYIWINQYFDSEICNGVF